MPSPSSVRAWTPSRWSLPRARPSDLTLLSLVREMTEYARHNGHADLLRHAIDGAVGE
jgi:hypothetical protein